MSDHGEVDRPLPDAVRRHVVEFASQCLGRLASDRVPPALRRVARFDPRRRARVAASQIAAHVDSGSEFRSRVAEYLREARPELTGAVEEGTVPAAADPSTVAAVAYLLRPEGWERFVAAAREEVQHRTAADEENARTIARLREQLTQTKSDARAEADKLRAELRSARGEIAELRRKLHGERERARRADSEAQREREAAEEERRAANAAASSSEAELRRLRSRVANAEAAAESARRSARAERGGSDARLRVLVDALLDAAQGLSRELALPATISRPADEVEAARPRELDARKLPGRALADDDPSLLDHLLALPRAHLVVDGYNVTKTGYGTLTLEDQRARLVTGLGALAAQTRAEVTCVFDGADVENPPPSPAPRGVRVLFSPARETADELICQLVRAEPAGRAVVVVSSDREIAQSVRRSGARPLPATALLRRLERG